MVPVVEKFSVPLPVLTSASVPLPPELMSLICVVLVELLVTPSAKFIVNTPLPPPLFSITDWEVDALIVSPVIVWLVPFRRKKELELEGRSNVRLPFPRALFAPKEIVPDLMVVPPV